MREENAPNFQPAKPVCFPSQLKLHGSAPHRVLLETTLMAPGCAAVAVLGILGFTSPTRHGWLLLLRLYFDKCHPTLIEPVPAWCMRRCSCSASQRDRASTPSACQRSCQDICSALVGHRCKGQTPVSTKDATGLPPPRQTDACL